MLDRAIQYAVAAARYGSFTAAADRVGVTQSAITKSVGDLEQRLGYMIFNRTARGTVLTEEGRDFIDQASRLLDDLNMLMRTARRKDPYAGPLRIGVCPASLEWMLLKPVVELTRRYPQILIDVSSSSYERMVQQLRSGSVDVALGFEAAFGEQPDFKREELGPLRTTYFARIGHPLAAQKHVTSHDLAQFQFVTPTVSQPYGASIRQVFEDEGMEAATRIHTVDYFPLVRRIVAQSDSIGVVSLEHGQTERFRQRFALLDLTEAIVPSRLCCAIRARWEPPPAVRAFINTCREALPPLT